jgi:hypothetical protein
MLTNFCRKWEKSCRETLAQALFLRPAGLAHRAVREFLLDRGPLSGYRRWFAT